ncbi:OadG family protein [Teredinibacter waterburyi]|jgi:sodium pump decarboxylases, gamma subunit|uniref:OadG family protein n=1 Tax=Teredinibacter waterburyi TaxID=1500538 RepID=UPI00165F68BE|nr:OadG family transporter subunit [Teredinibacter waterburyi]
MQTHLWNEGFDLLLYGMGTVFVFLTLLVLATTLMSKIVTRFFPEAPIVLPEPAVMNAHAESVDSRTLAIIKSAIQVHRAKQGKA